jgi:hypothetical protein
MQNLFFQGISGEGQYRFDRIGDPEGYCIAWCIWFVEMYVINEAKVKNLKDLKEFVINLSNKIISRYDTYLDYIRDYGNYLKNNQIRFFKSIKIPANRLYIKYYKPEEDEFILNIINNKLKFIF